MKTIPLLVFAIILLNCSRNDNPFSYHSGNIPIDGPPREAVYVPGEVGFGLQDSVSLDELADYIYSFNDISIKEVVSFQYYSSLPQDSMLTIKSVLETKSYIWNGTVTISYVESESKILIKFWIKNFEPKNRKDWNGIKERFHLIHSPFNFQLGSLTVEIGKENEWISVLSSIDLFRFVDLIYIMETMNTQ